MQVRDNGKDPRGSVVVSQENVSPRGSSRTNLQVPVLGLQWVTLIIESPISKCFSSANVDVIRRVMMKSDTSKTISKFCLDIFYF